MLYAQNFTTFDVYGPDSTYTQPAAINDLGQIVGSSMPSIPDCFGGPPAFCQQGFFRDTDGTISTVGPTPNRPNYFIAATLAINQWGLTVGSITDNSGTDGWLRSSDGTLTRVFCDAPPAMPVNPNGFQPAFPKFLFPPMYSPEFGSAALAINDWGQIAGVIGEGPGRGIAYLLNVDGTCITFQAPTSNNVSVFDTLPQAINDVGQITGYFADLTGWHGFLRNSNGKLAVFNSAVGDTFALAINLSGEITGGYNSTSGFHGFLRRPGGKIITLDPPGSVNTLATSINIWGQIAGFYFDSGGIGHGFTRWPNGHIDTFDFPGVGVSTTIAQGINDFGQITGYYVDASGTHGFFTQRP